MSDDALVPSFVQIVFASVLMGICCMMLYLQAVDIVFEFVLKTTRDSALNKAVMDNVLRVR